MRISDWSSDVCSSDLSLCIEAIAASFLVFWWWRDYPLATAAYLAVFHAIAAFNNAGFSLFPSSLSLFTEDTITILVISFSIILGGIGFSVLSDVGQKKRWNTLLPYTKAILLGTLALNLIGFVAIWALEFNNPGTLSKPSFHGQALGSEERRIR